MLHIVKSKNLLYSVEDVRQVVGSCKIRAECKSNFHQPDMTFLRKAAQPFERLNLDLDLSQALIRTNILLMLWVSFPDSLLYPHVLI